MQETLGIPTKVFAFCLWPPAKMLGFSSLLQLKLGCNSHMFWKWAKKCQRGVVRVRKVPCVTSQREGNQAKEVNDGYWMFLTNRVEAHIHIKTKMVNYILLSGCHSK